MFFYFWSRDHAVTTETVVVTTLAGGKRPWAQRRLAVSPAAPTVTEVTDGLSFVEADPVVLSGADLTDEFARKRLAQQSEETKTAHGARPGRVGGVVRPERGVAAPGCTDGDDQLHHGLAVAGTSVSRLPRMLAPLCEARVCKDAVPWTT